MIDFSLGDVGSVFKDIREAITGESISDPIKKAEINLKLKQLETSLQQGQIAINKAEAHNKNVFVSGWRPFVGWVCGLAIAYQFVIYPLLFSLFSIFDVEIEIPKLEIGMLFNLMISMLGMAGIRTYEKLKNIDTRHISRFKSPIKPTKEEKF